MEREELIDEINSLKATIRRDKAKGWDTKKAQSDLQACASKLATMDSTQARTPSKVFRIPRKGASPVDWSDYHNSAGLKKWDK